MGTKSGLLKKIIWILNLLVASATILSFAAAWISPENIWWLALFGLGFEILFAINILFIIYWLITRSRRFILSLAFVMLGLSKIFGIVQINFSHPSESDLQSKGYIKVMTFNVRLFNLYNWFHNTETRKKIFEFLEKESPDIICFQEFYSSDANDMLFKNDDTLRHYLKSPYSQIEYTYSFRKTDHWGIATFSKFPIIRQQATHFAKKGGNIYIESDVVAGNDTVRVFNCHLESVRFEWHDYKFIENLNNDDVDQDELQGSLSILRHLRQGFVRRAKQVNILRDSIDASPYPVILCGDFNDTPSSYTYSVLDDNLKDAFRESGNGAGKTYAGPFPSFRIDYIFHDKKIQSAGYRTIREKLSDHYPVSCMLKLPG
jgi:endonuclease/exonuclease/phosphatase family metal-dependent hydrolase